MKVEPVSERRNLLGEGPHWDARTSTLLYVDIEGFEVVRFDPETRTETEVVRLDGMVGNAIPYEEDHRKLVVCEENTVYKLDLDTKEKTHLVEMLDPDSPVQTRINDGKCDARGRLWAGTMAREANLKTKLVEKNNLYCYSQGSLALKYPFATLSNGIAWTADNRTMFYNDSIPGRMLAFDFDIDTGTLVNSRVLIDFQKTPGYQGDSFYIPDGMTTDVNDKIWLVCFGDGAVLQIDPETAKIITKIKIPAKYATSCCFGGKNYDILYVTSSGSLPDATTPGDGLTYQVTGLGAKGRPPYEFAG